MLLSIGYLERPSRTAPTLTFATAVILLLAVLAPASAHAHDTDVYDDGTVVYDDAGEDATDIGLIGDSSLAGVRWSESYGDLWQFNFVFNAESCRRTVETSCWSREGYRPDNAFTTMQEHSGQWGDVLVVMSGYNDTSYLFDDAVGEVVEEARRQGVPNVMWLTLRTADVNYEEPLHQANGDTYGEANRMLLDQAEEYDGYLQIADWATYSADRPEWVSADGVHLTSEGASELTSFIAERAGDVLDGETITPTQPPWAALSVGDSGDTVADVQQALIDEGVSSVGEVDGEYGEVTATAVQEFQLEQGLEETGAVDVATAVALGLRDAPDVGDTPDASGTDGGGDADARAAGSPREAATAGDPAMTAEPESDGAPSEAEMTETAASLEPGSRSGSWYDRETMVAVALMAIAGATAIAMSMRRRATRRQAAAARSLDPDEATASPYDETHELDRPTDFTSSMPVPVVVDPPYDHELEATPADASVNA